MFLSLPHARLCLSSKSLDSPLPPFLSPPASKRRLLPQNPNPHHRPIRASSASPTPQTLAKSTIQRITDKLRNLGYIDETPAADRPATGPGSPGEIFIPTPRDLPNHRVGHTIDSSWSTPEQPVPQPGAGIARLHDPWQARERPKRTPAQAPTVAELTLPPAELRRLRTAGIRLDKRLKVGKAGITEGIVNGIHERWRRSELVKLKCEDLCKMNMRRTHEILERKTGGLVVWRSGSIIILYRGSDYVYPYFSVEGQGTENLDEVSSEASIDDGTSSKQDDHLDSEPTGNQLESPTTSARSPLVVGVGSPNKVRFQLPGEVQFGEEFDKLLDGLGPRFTDWWGCDPLPVDADLLPPIVPGYRKPFRLLPFGVKPKLTDREMTILRRLGRPLPCHFALGRNRNLQGLAVSMIKLWQKCEIAKIAIKRGVQNTNSDLMAEELKELTGGTLLSRDKEFISFYRGKDFLPPAVSVAIEKRRNYETDRQKQNTTKNYHVANVPAYEPRRTRSSEGQEVTEPKKFLNGVKELASSNLAIKTVETELSRALEKKGNAEKLLEELDKSVEPSTVEPDKEAISKEERFMLRKVGLRMKPFLLLGRRGVFDGTVENMHLHWKYRELVKIICKERSIKDVHDAARILEAQSGGILVAVESVSKGHAIIIYRGKNYRRPVCLRPKTLLSKKEAMKRSLEDQRRRSLKLHILSLSKDIVQLKHQMAMDATRTDSMQVIQPEEIATTIENKENNVSEECNDVNAEFVNDHENDKEVYELDAESVDLTKDRYSLSDAEETIGIPIEQAQVSSSSTSSTSHISDKEPMELSFGASQRKAKTSDHEKWEGELDEEVPFRAAPLSNRERLILRKQALKTTKRPVLAVGRSNVLTGVVKTIKTHFRKHSLAIVNIKGRAKGTSVQEVIFELEQATGAVLVSREPNKVILYRGWGEGEVPGWMKVKDLGGSEGEGRASPQLIDAIIQECGLPTSQV